MINRFLRLKILFILLTAAGSAALSAEGKTALIIGNGAYKHLPGLNNPVPEALEMKKALESAGFTVIYVANCTKTEMQGAVKKFKQELDKNGGVALFHYGGHGMQLNGKNYLIPVDANVTEEWEVDSLCVDANYILSAMESSKSETNIVILDACRDNPLPGSSRSSTRGFARMEAPTNSIIIYSAGEGETARDGLFTPILVRYIRQGGMEFTTMVKAVRKEVYEASGQKQRPAEYSMLMGEVWLTAPVKTGATGTVSVDTKTGTLSVSAKSSGELYVDGVLKTTLKPGQTATVTDIPVGKHTLEIRYQGYSESRSVTVAEGKAFEAAFTWVRPAKQDSLVSIKGGSFLMGSPKSEEGRNDDEIQGRVTLSPFYMGAKEVTFAEYDQFCEATKRKKPADEGWGRGNRPVVNITWADAVEYCNWLSVNEGLTPCYNLEKKTPVTCDFAADGYRLPTEAEWEYACRAGTDTPFCYGTETVRDSMNSTLTDLGMTMETGGFDPNPWGLYDMHGNVREWCWDVYGSYLPGKQTDPKGPPAEKPGALSRVYSGSEHLLRGGGWDSDPEYCRSAFREAAEEGEYDTDIGFRIVRRGG
jgi:formylglycine-generating enzyme required for sulfatase activity